MLGETHISTPDFGAILKKGSTVLYLCLTGIDDWEYSTPLFQNDWEWDGEQELAATPHCQHSSVDRVCWI